MDELNEIDGNERTERNENQRKSNVFFRLLLIFCLLNDFVLFEFVFAVVVKVIVIVDVVIAPVVLFALPLLPFVDVCTCVCVCA